MYGTTTEIDIRCRLADPVYVDIFGGRILLNRSIKDGTDLGNANIFFTGHQATVQLDAEVTSRLDEAVSYRPFAKIENGTAGTVGSIITSCQIGTSTGRDVTVDKYVSIIGGGALLLGRTGGNSTITEYVAIDIPAPTITGTVNFGTRRAIHQRSPDEDNMFAGPVRLGQFMELNEQSVDPDDPQDGQTVVWMSDGTGSGDAGDIMMKITSGSTTKTVTLVDFSAS